jgi:hypothetical protein
MESERAMTRWVKVKGRQQLLEDKGDGTYTAWSFGIWGPVRSKGQLLPGVEVLPLKTKADKREAARMERLMKRSLETQLRMAYALSGNPNLLPARDDR